MRKLKMLAPGHTEYPQGKGKPSKIVPHGKYDTLTFEDAREDDAVRLVELGLAEDVTPQVQPLEAQAS